MLTREEVDIYLPEQPAPRAGISPQPYASAVIEEIGATAAS